MSRSLKIGPLEQGLVNRVTTTWPDVFLPGTHAKRVERALETAGRSHGVDKSYVEFEARRSNQKLRSRRRIVFSSTAGLLVQATAVYLLWQKSNTNETPIETNTPPAVYQKK